jgi:hypothetical protein
MACFLGWLNDFFLWIKFCILLTLIISWVLYVYLSLRFPSIHWLTIWDPRLRHLSLFTCRMEDMNFDDLSFLLGVIEIQWFSISLFIVFKSLCCNVTFSPTLWFFLYTLSMLTCNVKLFMCSLDYRSMYYNCNILYLASYAAWFVRCL